MRFSKKSLVSPEQQLKSSSVYIGYLILKSMEERQKMSIFDVFEAVKKANKIFNYNAAMQALFFLFMSGLIDFDAPYIYRMK